MLRQTQKIHWNSRSFHWYAKIVFWQHKIFNQGIYHKLFKHSDIPYSIRTDIDHLTKKLALKNSQSLGNLQKRMDATLLLPPSCVRGMTVLDRSAFVKKITVPLVTTGNENVYSAVTGLKKVMLKMEKLKPVQTDTENPNKKFLLLNPLLVGSVEDIKKEFSQIAEHGEVDFSSKEITLCYENWKADDIIKSVLPLNQHGSHGYSLIGSIIHLNLRDHLLPYKRVIGEVLLDKIQRVTLVVNKINMIDSTYRNFEMEVLAGTGETKVTVKENGCSFSFDFAHVYWNPRLSTEHTRIVQKIKHEDILYDVMAGVGPFAIPVARKGCKVLANDLNPHSYKSLIHNCNSNKVKEKVKCYNLDGHEFIKTVLKSSLLETWHNYYFCGAIHITMNLPALAVEFLSSFIGLFSYDDNVPLEVTLPFIHVYMFIKENDNDSAIAMVADKLGYMKGKMLSGDNNPDTDSQNETCPNDSWEFGELKKHIEEVAFVRTVAPNKVMMRVSFKMPREVLISRNLHTQEPALKKLKEC